MKAKELLVEYNRTTTATNWGDKLAAMLGGDKIMRTNPSLANLDETELLNWALEKLEDTDPTKNKQYVQWMIRKYLMGEDHFEDVISTLGMYLKKFHILNQKRKLASPRNDINRYQSIGDLMSVMDEYEYPTDREEDKGQAREYYSDDTVRVIIPEDEAAAKYYGQGTRWCTAANRSNMFNNYNRQGPMYIIIPKHAEYPGEKYQLHFESGQYMDEKDNPANLKGLAERYPGLKNAFRDQANEYFVIDLMPEREFDAFYDHSVRELQRVGIRQSHNLYTVNLMDFDSNNGVSLERCNMIYAVTGKNLQPEENWSEGGEVYYAVMSKDDQVLLVQTQFDYDQAEILLSFGDRLEREPEDPELLHLAQQIMNRLQMYIDIHNYDGDEEDLDPETRLGIESDPNYEDEYLELIFKDYGRPVKGGRNLEESVLLEYDRDKTIQNYGNKLKAVMDQDRTVDRVLGAGGRETADAQNILIPWALDAIEHQADPTANKQYTQWIVNNYIKGEPDRTNNLGHTLVGQRVKFEDLLSRIKPALQAYDTAKRRGMLPAEARDINRITIRQLWDLADDLRVEIAKRDQEKRAKTMPRGDAETVYEDDQVRVLIPRDQDAACYYGQGTRWCTASTEGQNYYGRYSSEGPLYIVLPKTPRHAGEKYQLHFPSEQFMDEGDDQTPLEDIFLRYPGLEEFFKERERDFFEDQVVWTPDEVLKPLLDKMAEYMDDKLWEIVGDWEMEDDYWHQYRVEKAKEKGYVDSDGEVDWDRVHEDDDLNDYLAWNYEANDWLKDARQAVHMPPDEAKYLAHEAWIEDGYTIRLDALPYLLETNVEQTLGRDQSDNVVKMIRKHLDVDKFDESGQNKTKKGTWQVRWFSPILKKYY